MGLNTKTKAIITAMILAGIGVPIYKFINTIQERKIAQQTRYHFEDLYREALNAFNNSNYKLALIKLEQIKDIIKKTNNEIYKNIYNNLITSLEFSIKAQQAIDKGDYKLAIDFIISAKGALEGIKDNELKNQTQRKLSELELALGKELAEKQKIKIKQELTAFYKEALSKFNSDNFNEAIAILAKAEGRFKNNRSEERNLISTFKNIVLHCKKAEEEFDNDDFEKSQSYVRLAISFAEGTRLPDKEVILRTIRGLEIKVKTRGIETEERQELPPVEEMFKTKETKPSETSETASKYVTYFRDLDRLKSLINLGINRSGTKGKIGSGTINVRFTTYDKKLFEVYVVVRDGNVEKIENGLSTKPDVDITLSEYDINDILSSKEPIKEAKNKIEDKKILCSAHSAGWKFKIWLLKNFL
ncbi:hypothetical protein HYU23_02070 [Candidatus Woesearchaeota archaeon]|nr:hypothetical protein [Candidatus Woesearchaeota archaeon]